MNSVSSNAVANNTVRRFSITVQGNDAETCIKAMLDLLSNNVTGCYGGFLNAVGLENGNCNVYNILDPATNYRVTVGLIEFMSNIGVYYVSRNSIGSDAPTYNIKRVDLPLISEKHTATKIDARFPSGSIANCFWWRCGRIITVDFYASQVLSTYNHLDPCFSGLPKPIVSSGPQGSPYWGGQPSQFMVVIDDNGNLCTNGNANNGTDVMVSGLCSFTYVTTDN